MYYDIGWIRSVGVSNYSPNQLRTAHKYLTDRGIPFASNQVQYSLLSRTAEFSKVIETAEELGNDDDGSDYVDYMMIVWLLNCRE